MHQSGRKLLISLALFGSLLTFGTLGSYCVCRIDDVPGERSLVDAFYFTLVVLTTVGMESPVSALERVFSIVLMLVGIFLAAAAASNVVAFAIDGELNKHFGRRKLEKLVKDLDAHFIVVGFGRMGRALCDRLIEATEPFVLIERQEALAEQARARGLLCVCGDATDEDTLRAAGIERAAGLATCLPNDPANVFVTLTARGMRPAMEIVARAEDPATEAKLIRAGANRVICPPVVGAARLHEMLVKPVIADLIPATSAEADLLDVCAVNVGGLPALVGRTLAEANIQGRTGMIVAAHERDGATTFSPPDNTRLGPEDKLYLMGPDGGSRSLILVFGSGPMTPMSV